MIRKPLQKALRCRHPAWQALQVTLHAGRRALELREVFVSQTIKPERAGLVTELLEEADQVAQRSAGAVN